MMDCRKMHRNLSCIKQGNRKAGLRCTSSDARPSMASVVHHYAELCERSMFPLTRTCLTVAGRHEPRQPRASWRTSTASPGASWPRGLGRSGPIMRRCLGGVGGAGTPSAFTFVESPACR